MKRIDYLSWNDYFMAVALLSAQRSKDPNTQVGACIVGEDKRIIGVGYNGFPNGCSDDELSWEKEGDFLNTKYASVIHAELNSIMNSNTNLNNTIMYVTLFPCNECAKAIIQAGVKKIYYLDDKYHDRDFSIAARKLFDLAGIKYEKYVPMRDVIEIRMKVK